MSYLEESLAFLLTLDGLSGKWNSVTYYFFSGIQAVYLATHTTILHKMVQIVGISLISSLFLTTVWSVLSRSLSNDQMYKI